MFVFNIYTQSSVGIILFHLFLIISIIVFVWFILFGVTIKSDKFVNYIAIFLKQI